MQSLVQFVDGYAQCKVTTLLLLLSWSELSVFVCKTVCRCGLSTATLHVMYNISQKLQGHIS